MSSANAFEVFVWPRARVGADAHVCSAVRSVRGRPRRRDVSEPHIGGEDFQRYYETPAELAGARYARKAAYRSILYADRLWPAADLRGQWPGGAHQRHPAHARSLRVGVWVTYECPARLRARTQVYNSFGTYRWPAAFLNHYYDTVYDNGDSKVYHGH